MDSCEVFNFVDAWCNDSYMQFKARKCILEVEKKLLWKEQFLLKNQSYLKLLVFVAHSTIAY